METIDYVYRFDPRNPIAKPVPPDAESAKRQLEDGNRVFARWMERCQRGDFGEGESPRYVVQCNGAEAGARRTPGQMLKQAPFAVVVGCSDARVPTEMVFGQGFNDLFVIRVAGNVLGDECLGSIDFALSALSDSVRVIVMLGHTGCGAVTGAVDAYLRPLNYWSKSTSNNLRSILRRIFVSVREADSAVKDVWGDDARSLPGYRDALIEIAVTLNAAQAAADLRTEVERAGKWEIEVYYGVYDTRTHRVSTPTDAKPPEGHDGIRLTHSPTNPRDFATLAHRMARALLPADAPSPPHDGQPVTPDAPAAVERDAQP